MIKKRAGAAAAASPRHRQEYSPLAFWALAITLWAVAIGAGGIVLTRWQALDWRPLALYAGLLGLYLIAERRAHALPTGPSVRGHEPRRYVLSLLWWLLVLTSPAVYALRPAVAAPAVAGAALLTVAASAMRVWSVHLLGRYYSGHIEAWPEQTVIQAGPYRLIRHPGYAGSMLQALALPLVLGAYPCLLLAAAVCGLFIWRLLAEERFLARQVPGYAGYMARTRRLIPHLW